MSEIERNPGQVLPPLDQSHRHLKEAILDPDLDPASPFTGGDLRVTVDVPAAQIRTLMATPVELIPAPGVGKAIWVKRVLTRFTFVSVAYNTSQLDIEFDDAIYGMYVSGSPFLSLGVSWSSFETLSKYSEDESAWENIAVVLGVAGVGNPGSSGDGTLRVTLDYEIVTL